MFLLARCTTKIDQDLSSAFHMDIRARDIHCASFQAHTSRIIAGFPILAGGPVDRLEYLPHCFCISALSGLSPAKAHLDHDCVRPPQLMFRGLQGGTGSRRHSRKNSRVGTRGFNRCQCTQLKSDRFERFLLLPTKVPSL